MHRWQREVSQRFHDRDEEALDIVTALLSRIMMRHTKNMSYATDGTNLLVLPAKRETVQWIKMSDKENGMYHQLETYIREIYRRLSEHGEAVIRKNTIKLLSLIKDLQMTCSGGNMPVRLAKILNRAKDGVIPLPAPEEEDDGLGGDGEEEGESLPAPRNLRRRS